jgi:twitching motility protein PilT
VPLERAALTPEETSTIADAIVPADRVERFEKIGEVDFAYSVAHVGRFRVNVVRQMGLTSMVLRRLAVRRPELRRARTARRRPHLSEENRGLVLVTGPTGSGKTTTLASMIEHINRTEPVHVVTIEDPIEVLFKDEVASINQREIHEVIAEGGYYGMFTFDQSLLALVQAGRISVEAAMEASTAPNDLELMLQQAGIAGPTAV